eukprot:CAMPEP_0172298458 /NCGR_PEP_ID=MMETSP1058-20130122/1107_1 /TAXON_ID=83371 /ORGANISM="Detonula confervacea, Strain CCMP 353" /LENGTH=348 /DNA_ID=CAMNT_0013007733 /DNA_START=108 /DNA_END=1154 /DNA_ORIENTATION=-
MMQRFAILLLLSLSAIQCASAESTTSALRTTSNHAASHQRRELAVSDWWYTFLNALHMPCPHGHSEDHPLGHCAHHSHDAHPSSGGGGGGGGGGGTTTTTSSSGCTDDSGCTDVATDDAAADSGCGEDGDDSGCGDDDAAADTGCGDDGNDDGSGCGDEAADVEGWTADWDNDGYDNGWESNNLNSASTGYNDAGGSGSGKIWGMAVGVAGLVGAAAFLITRKRKQRDLDQDENIPENVYVQETDSAHDDDMNASTVSHDNNNAPVDMEMQSVRTNMSRSASIKSAISKGSMSIRSKFSRSRSARNNDFDNNADGDYQAPIAEEGGFDNDSIPSNDDQYDVDDEGVVV